MEQPKVSKILWLKVLRILCCTLAHSRVQNQYFEVNDKGKSHQVQIYQNASYGLYGLQKCKSLTGEQGILNGIVEQVESKYICGSEKSAEDQLLVKQVTKDRSLFRDHFLGQDSYNSEEEEQQRRESQADNSEHALVEGLLLEDVCGGQHECPYEYFSVDAGRSIVLEHVQHTHMYELNQEGSCLRE